MVMRRPSYASTDALALANPDVGGNLSELAGRLVTESELRPTESARLETKSPDRDYHIELIQAGDRYVWGMAGADGGQARHETGRTGPDHDEEHVHDVAPDAHPRPHVCGTGLRRTSPRHRQRPTRHRACHPSSTPTIPASGCSTATTPTTSRPA